MASPKTELTRSQQDYLKALYALAPAGQPVAPSFLAARLGVSAPSVTNMVSRLAAQGLVVHDRRTGTRLTAQGRRQAVHMVRRHRLLETFLVRVLEFDWSEVHEDAEVLEHHVSDRVLEALDRHMGHPREDPHGHPIPNRTGRLRRRSLRRLQDVPGGRRAIVREIRDADVRRMARWKEIGLVPGAQVRIVEVRPLEDVFVIEVRGRRMITGSEGLDGVMVDFRGGARGI
jgi:DtxR family Mn-dependent transcriptional regulator